MRRTSAAGIGFGLALLTISVGAEAIGAQDHWGEPGDYVYRVVTLQAAPGRLFDLMDLYRGYFDELDAIGEERPMWMRHSQGDQWDLMTGRRRRTPASPQERSGSTCGPFCYPITIHSPFVSLTDPGEGGGRFTCPPRAPSPATPRRS